MGQLRRFSLLVCLKRCIGPLTVNPAFLPDHKRKYSERGWDRPANADKAKDSVCVEAVSYTHLTLPTMAVV